MPCACKLPLFHEHSPSPQMETRPLIRSSSQSVSDTSSIKESKACAASEDVVELDYSRGQNSKKRTVWPLVVVVGQLTLLAIAYGFFSAVRVRGHIPLSLELAELAQRNPQAKTYLVTFLATALSTLSSFLFSQAIRHLILVYLSRPIPISVSTLGFGILISRRSPIFRRRQHKWVLAAGLFSLATLGQTASWTSLLTPIQIVIPTPLQGTDIDLSSEAFNNQFAQLWNVTGGLQSYIDSGISAIMDTSGAADAADIANGVSVFDFNDWVYVGSTRGILPIKLVESAEQTSMVLELVTTNTEPFPGPISGSNFNVSMFQPGLTANTSCEYKELDASTNPSLERFTESVEITVNGQSELYTAVGITSICNGQTLQSDVVTNTNNTLLSVSCYGVDDNGEIIYTVIIDGQGLYNGTVVCAVAPVMVPSSIVTYTGSWVYTMLSEADVYAKTTPATAAVAYAALYGVDQALSYGQSATHSIVGDSINALLVDKDTPQESSLPYVLSFPLLLGVYIGAVVEFVGTAVKTNLASSTGPLAGEIPLNMRVDTSGFALTTTFGWEYTAGINNAILLPSTLVALASILIVIFAQCMMWIRGISVEHGDFDPNDPLLLMAAASAGGMADTFHGLTKENIEEGAEKKVILAQVGNRDGLVQIP
ncbi:hypothetical protein B0H11DRAFT_1389128 [Mycena galericulata]|nr:hypothetical protein B0H11DRAFT_1389128 [Mycena galericulata]